MRTKLNQRGRLNDGSPNPIDVHVGRRMSERRIALGMSQDALGRLIGITFQQVQKYGRGHNRIGASRLYDIARALGVEVGYFFEGMPEYVTVASPASLRRGTTTLPPTGEGPTLKTLRLAQRIDVLKPSHRTAISELVTALENAAADGTTDSIMEAVNGAPV